MEASFRFKETWLGFGLWCFLGHFQQYFGYIVAVSFIGGENRRRRDSSSVIKWSKNG
jgi:hypothetical protein